MWTEVWFGKHKGKTLPQIVFSDPDYFFWAYEQKVFAGKGPVEQEAEKIFARATRIRIPSDGERRVAVYRLHMPTGGTFGGLSLMSEAEALEEGDSFVPLRNDVIDLSVPRQMKAYDKFGGHLLVRDLKFYVFGSSSARLTARTCEAFFEDEGNFVLDSPRGRSDSKRGRH